MADAAASHGLIGARRARSLAYARRRSGLVRVLRYVLLIAIVAVIANAGLQLVMTSLGGTREAAFAPAGSNERIVNPRFTGRDEGGAPFMLTADAAVRSAGAVAGVAELERPELDYGLLERNDVSQVLARTGLFNEAEKTLLLSDDVRFTTRSGYTFSTQSALVRLREGQVEGDAPVLGEAPWGAMRANAFDVRDDGQRIIMSGDVRTRIYMNRSPEAQEAQP